ncbi:putative ATPase with chaperone activity [Brassicibacter mesophilus]
MFLDELPEFKKSVIEVLRQPMEDGIVSVSRISASLTYPAKFMLVASMNPCPCGYYGDALHECTCSQRSIEKYLGKISGPLLDRIDIHVEASPIEYKDLENEKRNKVESSQEIKKRVNKARNIQLSRYRKEKIFSNSELSPKNINKYCMLNTKSKKLLKDAFLQLGLSARAYNKVLKIARTIADIDDEEIIQEHHIAEAIQYRTLDRRFR